jgi:hypothetical protein
MIKIAVGVTGASGSVYAKVLLDKLQQLKEQVAEVSVVWSDNARTVWQHELGNDLHGQYGFKIWDKNDFMAPFASGSSSYSALDYLSMQHGHSWAHSRRHQQRPYYPSRRCDAEGAPQAGVRSARDALTTWYTSAI